MRIVSLCCSNTEIVCALGCANWLVGVDDHSDYPEEVVTKLPRVGPDLQIDINKVADLHPDLVLASLTVPGHEHVVAGLEQAGLPFLAPEPISLADTYRDIRDIAKALGKPEAAEQVIERMRQGIPCFSPLSPSSSLSSPPPTSGTPTDLYRPKILVQWWPKPVIAPGRLSWVHDLIEAAGGTNPLGHEDVKSRPITDEEVVALAPDAIVISWCGVQLKKYRPDVIYRNALWQDLPALQNRHVFCVTEAFLGRPSPRLADGFRALSDIVQQIRHHH